LTTLDLWSDQLTNFSFLSGLTNLTWLTLDDNQLTTLTLPAGLTSLVSLELNGNHLTSLTLPTDMASLYTLTLYGNHFTDFSFLNGLRNLTWLGLENNQLTSLTLPEGLTSLTYLELGGNPLETFVLPESLAVTSMVGTVAILTAQGVTVYTYPHAVSLASTRPTVSGAFGFTLTGPPKVYDVLSSTDLSAWNQLGTLTNTLGAAVFTDPQATNSSQKFYRAVTTPQ
jgi:internalin A